MSLYRVKKEFWLKCSSDTVVKKNLKCIFFELVLIIKCVFLRKKGI